jgi:hypothetical protein
MAVLLLAMTSAARAGDAETEALKRDIEDLRKHMARASAASPSQNGGSIGEKARATAAKLEKSVLSVRLVLKMKISMMGQTQDQEQKVELTGTVIDPSGLTVVDAFSADPTTMIKSMLGGAMGGQMKIDSEVKETTLILDDGTEVDADVVLKDTDLGMAFIRPRDTSKKFDAVELKERKGDPQLLDEIFVIGREGKLGKRAPSLELNIIKSIVKGPKPFYICSKESAGSLGNMAYSADGQPLGIFVMKLKEESGEAGGGQLGMLMNMMGGGAKDMALPILRPVNDIIEIAEQAKKAKAPEKKVEATAPKEEK